MPTLRQGLYDLLGSVQITTKEYGKTRVEPWLSQRLVIDAVAKGLSEDVHTFVILKCRQAAITTTASIISLFWSLLNEGTQGATIADRSDNLERLRRIFADLLNSLPPEWRGPEHRIITNNRNGIVIANGSTIDLLAAASNPDLGASRAINLGHFTECSLWKSLAGVESLRASLAQTNPKRLFVFESIANGIGNWYYQFCQQAKQDRHMKFVFVGFWAVPVYQIPKDHEDYRVYWDGSLTEEEIARCRFVRQEYGYTIKPTQLAWRRREAEFRAPEYLDRHFPFTERECFIASGSGFFPAQRTLEIGEALAAGPPYKAYKYTFTDKFLDSRIDQTTNRDEAHLKVWEAPQPNGVYAIGCDPSGGGGGDANDHAVEVFRCYSDRLVQVAEYVSNVPFTYQIAWVMAHLAGAYRKHVLNFEVTGVGAAILPEIRNLRQLANMGLLNAVPGVPQDQVMAMIGAVRWYLYHRQDTMSGKGNVIAWKANADSKASSYSALRDSIMQRHIEFRSIRLIQQIQAVVEDNGWIGAGPDTGENDDMVSAAVLANWAWVDEIRDELNAKGMTWDSQHKEPPPLDPSVQLSRAFTEFYQDLNRRARPNILQRF